MRKAGLAKFVACVIGMLLLPALGWSETIVLKNGTILTGTILSLPSTMVELLTPEGRILVPRDEVLAISYATAAQPVAGATPSTAFVPAAAPGPAAPQAEPPEAPPEAVAATEPAPKPEDPLAPYLDQGGFGAKLLVNPYTTLRAHYAYQSKKQGNVPFSGGLGVFAEYMSKYVGVGFEIDFELLQATSVWEKKEGTWDERAAKGDEGRFGGVVHVWPYFKVRIPTRVVDPYFLLHFGYANYIGSFEGIGPFDGVALCPRVGVAWKVSRKVAVLADVGYDFAHFESRNPKDDNDVEIHNLKLNVGVQYRF